MTTEPDTTTTGSARRRATPTILFGVVVVLICGASIWFFGRDDRPRAEAGQLVDPESGVVVTGRSTTVAIPWGRLVITAGQPVEELPTKSLMPPDLRAPRGGSFVGLTVNADAKQLLPLPRTLTGDVLAPGLVLVADGRRYPVEGLVQVAKSRGNLAPGERSGFVAVKGTPTDLKLEVEYDGRRQTVDLNGGPGEPGRFAELDRVTMRYAERDCGRATWPARFGNALETVPRCRITWAQRMPYVAGLGWAPDGKTWLVVTQLVRHHPVQVSWHSPSGQRAEYVVDTDDSRTRFSLNGKPPAAVVEINALQGFFVKYSDDPRQAIFPVDPAGGPLTLTVVRDLHTGDLVERADGAPDRPVVPIGWRVSVP